MRATRVVDLNFISEKDMESLTVAQLIIEKTERAKQIRMSFYEIQDQVDEAYAKGDIEAGNMLQCLGIDTATEYEKVALQIEAIQKAMAGVSKLAMNRKLVGELLR